MTVAWTSTAALQRAVGPSVVLDAYADDCVAASNAWCWRKRVEAGYDDDPLDGAPAPSPDVAQAATLYAVALWRERASTDGYASFQDLGSFPTVGGSLGQINRLLGVGRGRVDSPPDDVAVTPYRRIRWPA